LNSVIEQFKLQNNSIPQSTKEYIAQARSKFFSRDKLRSIAVFFGFGEEKPFYLETTPSLVVVRIQHNMTFFYLNYFVITAVLFILTLLISPGAIIGIGLLGLAWVGVIRATQEGSCTVKGITISQKHATIGMSGISIMVLIYLLSNIFWWALASSGFLTGLHALFRDASMHKDEEDKVQMTGDISGEDSAFLNPVDLDVV